jgi:phospholipid/cholesterol/gamma-HCH transport system substrate-binding protein
MDLHYQKEIAVGTLVLTAIGLFIGGSLWLKGTSFKRSGPSATVVFTEIGTLQRDNEVVVSGYAVGKVQEVEFKGPGRILVTITVPRELDLHADASASLLTSIFAGSTKLSLNPGTAAAGPLPPDQPIPGSSGADLFAKGALLADRTDSVLIGVQALANQRTADELIGTLQAMQRTLNTMNNRLPATTTEIESTLRAFRALSRKLDSTLSTIPVGNAVERADTLARNLSVMSIQLTATGARLDTLLQRINAGEGTIGKFASDSGFYVDTRAALQALKLLIDDLSKHPGKLNIQVKLF